MVADWVITKKLGYWLARQKMAGRFWHVLVLVTLVNCVVAVGINWLFYMLIWPDSIAEEWVSMVFLPVGIVVVLTTPVLYLDYALVLALMRKRDDLTAQIRHDFLTGVASRGWFESRTRAAFAEQDGGGAFLVADIDYFKSVNDIHGHAVGDAILARVGAALTSVVRREDLVGRIGGEEFAVYMPGIDTDSAVAIGERLREAVSEASVVVPGTQGALSVTISVGLLHFEAPRHFEEIYARADAALYRAKDAGRDRLVVAPELAA